MSPSMSELLVVSLQSSLALLLVEAVSVCDDAVVVCDPVVLAGFTLSAPGTKLLSDLRAVDLELAALLDSEAVSQTASMSGHAPILS